VATNDAATEKINYYKLLGGGKEPFEEWETYEIEAKQLEASDERVAIAQHSRLLSDARRKTRPVHLHQDGELKSLRHYNDQASNKQVDTDLEAHLTRQARI
jgi:hypothetical protein